MNLGSHIQAEAQNIKCFQRAETKRWDIITQRTPTKGRLNDSKCDTAAPRISSKQSRICTLCLVLYWNTASLLHSLPSTSTFCQSTFGIVAGLIWIGASVLYVKPASMMRLPDLHFDKDYMERGCRLHRPPAVLLSKIQTFRRYHTRYSAAVPLGQRQSHIRVQVCFVPSGDGTNEIAITLRDAFVGPKGCLLLTADYSQLELR